MRKNPSPLRVDRNLAWDILLDLTSKAYNSYNDFVGREYYAIKNNFLIGRVGEIASGIYEIGNLADGSLAPPVTVRFTLQSGIEKDLDAFFDAQNRSIYLTIIDNWGADDNAIAHTFNKLKFDEDSDNRLMNYLYVMLVHELTHAKETDLSLKRPRNLYGETTSDADQMKYINVPVELAAFINTALAEIEVNDPDYDILQEFYDDRDSFPNFFTAYLDEVLLFTIPIHSKLTPKNKRKYVNVLMSELIPSVENYHALIERN